MPYIYALAEHGSTLATRPLGEELRADLKERAKGEDFITLDFMGVLSTSHSFADEFVAKLAEEAASGEVEFEIFISGASSEIERIVRKALERRSVALPIAA